MGLEDTWGATFLSKALLHKQAALLAKRDIKVYLK